MCTFVVVVVLSRASDPVLCYHQLMLAMLTTTTMEANPSCLSGSQLDVNLNAPSFQTQSSNFCVKLEVKSTTEISISIREKTKTERAQ